MAACAGEPASRCRPPDPHDALAVVAMVHDEGKGQRAPVGAINAASSSPSPGERSAAWAMSFSISAPFILKSQATHPLTQSGTGFCPRVKRGKGS